MRSACPPILAAASLGVVLACHSCTPSPFQAPQYDYSLAKSIGSSAEPKTEEAGSGNANTQTERFQNASEATEAPTGSISLRTVVSSVVTRYPPYLSSLLERDLASGRLQSAMGAFDTNIAAKVGGRLQGFYESTVMQGVLEQPLATGDTIYGGYRVSDGFLPDYYKDRTQDDGEFVFGGSFPLLQNRGFDKRRAGVRKAEIDLQLAEPKILAARIEYVRRATAAYFKWTAAGRKVTVAQELLKLATDREDGLQRAVDREFLAPIVLTDNNRLIAKRRIYIAQAERGFQAAGLKLSLYLRDADDRPIVPSFDNLPEPTTELPGNHGSLDQDLALAARQRPDLRELTLKIEKADTERRLADNQVLPELNLVVEAASSLSDGPYKDREDFELFVGGELKVPFQRRGAKGRLQQAEAMLSRLMIKRRFARDRIVNDILDAHSAMDAVARQLEQNKLNVTASEVLVAAEQRKMDLGQSELLRVQLREAQLADARMMAIEALLGYREAYANYRAALGFGGE